MRKTPNHQGEQVRGGGNNGIGGGGEPVNERTDDTLGIKTAIDTGKY